MRKKIQDYHRSRGRENRKTYTKEKKNYAKAKMKKAGKKTKRAGKNKSTRKRTDRIVFSSPSASTPGRQEKEIREVARLPGKLCREIQARW